MLIQANFELSVLNSSDLRFLKFGLFCSLSEVRREALKLAIKVDVYWTYNGPSD